MCAHWLKPYKRSRKRVVCEVCGGGGGELVGQWTCTLLVAAQPQCTHPKRPWPPRRPSALVRDGSTHARQTACARRLHRAAGRSGTARARRRASHSRTPQTGHDTTPHRPRVRRPMQTARAAAARATARTSGAVAARGPDAAAPTPRSRPRSHHRPHPRPCANPPSPRAGTARRRACPRSAARRQRAQRPEARPPCGACLHAPQSRPTAPNPGAAASAARGGTLARLRGRSNAARRAAARGARVRSFRGWRVGTTPTTATTALGKKVKKVRSAKARWGSGLVRTAAACYR